MLQLEALDLRPLLVVLDEDADRVGVLEDVDGVAREAARGGARVLLTTAKDAVKLRGFHFPLPCYVVEIELEFEDEGKLLGLIRAALSR